MKEKQIQIFSSEWKLMEFLWEDSPRTLMEIVHAMAERVGWAKSTVTTMVARMEGKGLLRYEAEGRPHHDKGRGHELRNRYVAG